MAFLEQTEPIATCKASVCISYPVSKEVHCHFRPQELAHSLLIFIPGFIIAGAGVLAFWIVIMVIKERKTTL